MFTAYLSSSKPYTKKNFSLARDFLTHLSGKKHVLLNIKTEMVHEFE